jgi:hypothetical protein
LIGPLGQLGNPWKLTRRHSFEINVQLQTLQKVSQTRGMRQQVVTLRVLPIEFGATAIFLGNFEAIEHPAMLEEPRDKIWFRRQIQNQDFRAIGFDFGTFDRVVIDENETIESKLELLGKGFQIFGFRLPVKALCGEVFLAQRHIQTALKYFQDVALVILAAQAQQHSCSMLRAHEFLQLPAYFVQPDTLRAVFATNARPESVVAIQRDDLVWGAAKGMELSRNSCR